MVSSARGHPQSLGGLPGAGKLWKTLCVRNSEERTGEKDQQERQDEQNSAWGTRVVHDTSMPPKPLRSQEADCRTNPKKQQGLISKQIK
jgi:hypothetical protein